MNDQHLHEKSGNGNGSDDHTTTPSGQSRIQNPKSKYANHPLGPDWIAKYNALILHRQALERLLVNAMTAAAADIARAAAGHSPFHNEIEFRAACKLLDLLPTLRNAHDVEIEAIDRLEELRERGPRTTTTKHNSDRRVRFSGPVTHRTAFH
jgi:hypothetical protein